MYQQKKSFKVLGIMSGTSFDGIDLCLTEFQQSESSWSFKILATETVLYRANWKEKILKVESGDAANLMNLHFEYGRFLGRLSKDFLSSKNQTADYISSHGHTIFHQIENGFTFQLGHGAAIAASSNIKCIADFRSLDVALGGQGAPLVPIGDKLLFPEFSCCINIGGIANLSFEKNNKRVAFDIAPANMVLNYLYQKEFNKEFDINGELASSGKLNHSLFENLNQLDFFKLSGPKSLGKEWVFEEVIPLFHISIPIEDKLFTFSTHLIHQISLFLKQEKLTDNILVTGGGAKNDFLIHLLKEKEITIAETTTQIIDFKEALIFAFLGLLRVLGIDNTLKEVTGATKNSCGGSIYFP